MAESIHAAGCAATAIANNDGDAAPTSMAAAVGAVAEGPAAICCANGVVAAGAAATMAGGDAGAG